MVHEPEPDFDRQILDRWAADMVELLADAGLSDLAIPFVPMREGSGAPR